MRADRTGWPATARQLGRYVAVAGIGTAVNAGLYLVLRTWWDVPPSTLAALVVSTLLSTEANRRFTFAAHRADPRRTLLQTAATVVCYAGYSSLALAVLGVLVAEPTPVQESAALAVASVLGGIGRFLVLRRWVFADAAPGAGSRPARAAGARGLPVPGPLPRPAVPAGSAPAA